MYSISQLILFCKNEEKSTKITLSPFTLIGTCTPITKTSGQKIVDYLVGLAWKFIGKYTHV